MKNAAQTPTAVVSTVGPRELHEQTDQVLRRVSEEGEAFDIVHDGEVLARLEPHRPVDSDELAAIWARRRRLAAEIGAHWPEGVSAVDAVRE